MKKNNTEQEETEATEMPEKWREATPKQRRNWFLYNARSDREDALHDSEVFKLEEFCDKLCREFDDDIEFLYGFATNSYQSIEEDLKYEAIRQGSSSYQQLKPPHPYWMWAHQKN